MLDAFNETSSIPIANLEGYDEDTLKELIASHLDGTPVQTSTDGSLKGPIGTYSYLLFLRGETVSLTYGGGKEDYTQVVEQCLSAITSHRVSSTRMEALALLALHIALKFIDPMKRLT